MGEIIVLSIKTYQQFKDRIRAGIEPAGAALIFSDMVDGWLEETDLKKNRFLVLIGVMYVDRLFLGGRGLTKLVTKSILFWLIPLEPLWTTTPETYFLFFFCLVFCICIFILSYTCYLILFHNFRQLKH